MFGAIPTGSDRKWSVLGLAQSKLVLPKLLPVKFGHKDDSGNIRGTFAA